MGREGGREGGGERDYTHAVMFIDTEKAGARKGEKIAHTHHPLLSFSLLSSHLSLHPFIASLFAGGSPAF